MALSRVKVWSAGEILYALDLNNEFENILDNALSLISPLTTSLNAGGFKITNYGGTDAPTSTTDAALNAFVQSGTGAATRTLQDKLRDIVSVKDFDATGDGVTDDTEAFEDALATGKCVWIPNGTYLVDHIALPAGSCLQGETMEGAVIKLSGASAKGIYTDNQGLNTGLISDFYNHNILRDFTVDANDLANASTSYGIYFYKSWGNLVENVRDAQNPDGSIRLPNDAYSFGSGTGMYTSVINNCEFKKINHVGASGSDRVTTLTYVGLSGQHCRLENALAINFFAPTMQGALDKFDMTVVQNVNVYGGDIEGTGTFLKANGGNIDDVLYMGQNFAGFSGTLKSGTFNFVDTAYNFAWQHSQDRGTFTVAAVCGTSGTITLDQNTGSYSRIGNRIFFNANLSVASVSSPVGELTFTGLPVSAKAGNSGGGAVSVVADGLTVGATTAVVAYLQGGTATINVRKFSAGNNSALAGNVQGGSAFWISGNYPVA